MKKSEAIKKYWENIKKQLPDLYRAVLDSDGRIQYDVYVWENGEVQILEDVQGSTAYLKPKDMEPRELFYVTRIELPNFDPWDYSDHATPDDPEEREAERSEITYWLLEEYSRNLPDLLDSILTGAEQEEEYEIHACVADE